MEKFIETPNKKKEIDIFLETERLFSIKLLKALGSEYTIMKSGDKYISIDFILINKRNLKHTYLEHKKRSCKSNKYTSTIINECKIKSIKENYHKCFFIFEYDDNVEFIKYERDVFSTFDGGFIKNQNVRFLKKDDLSNGFDLLVKTLILELN
jgi:hypothetical protein